MSISVIIGTFKSDGVIRRSRNAILELRYCHTVYDIVIPTATSHFNSTN